MMRWSDLGAALRVSPRVLLRLDLWLGVLRRALFSRVFVGYVLVSFMLFMAGRQVFLAMQAPSSGPYAIALSIAIGMLASVLVYFFAVFLLPYCYWVFNPVAARLLPDYLELPPALDVEPWFGAYLWWTLPVLGTTVLYFLLMLLPVRSVALQAIAIALQLLAIINLFVRSALAAFFAPADIDRFLHATRWQRRLMWLPIMVGTGWLVQLVMAQWIQWQAIAGVFSDVVLGSGMVGFMLMGVTQMAIALLIGFAISAFCATVFVAAMLLAGSRMVTPAATAGPASSSLHSITMPYPPEPARQASRAGFAASRRAWRWVAAVAILLPAGAYFARVPLADWYLSSQESYLSAPATLKAQGHGFDASDRQGRLTAGYIVAGCYGDIDRMRWLRRIGLDRSQADPVALACAACEGKFEAVRWMLAQDEALRPNDVILRSDGYAKRMGSALSCAAIRGETGVVETLLARGARPALLGPRASAVNMAAYRHDWTMVSMLLRADAGAAGLAIFSALDGARGQAAQMLPHMLTAGLSLNVRDEFQRSVFHWAAMRHDLALARALMEHAAGLPAEVGPAGADLQGALPWMHVLRKAELDRRPLSPEAGELLRLLLPQQVDANAVVGRPPAGVAESLPEGWSARDAVLNDPVAGEALSAALDIGRLPADPAKWWRFSSAEAAARFVRSASMTQLMRAENPDAPEGMEPRKLSAGLIEAGWPELAKEVTLAVQGRRR